MAAQRLRRWPNIEPALGESIMSERWQLSDARLWTWQESSEVRTINPLTAKIFN